MIALDSDVVAESITFEGVFGRERFRRIVCFLHVDEREPAVVVDKHGGASKSFVGRLSFALSHQPGCRALQLVKGYNVARGLGWFKCGDVPFVTPGSFGSFSEEACGADGDGASQ